MMEDDQLDFGDLDDFDDTPLAIDQDLVIESTIYEDEIAKMERELGLDNATQPAIESDPLTTQSSLYQLEVHTKTNTAIKSHQEDQSKNNTASKGKNSPTAAISSRTATPSSNSSDNNNSPAAAVEARARRFGKKTIQQRTNTTHHHDTHPSRQPRRIKPSSTPPAVVTPVPSLSSARRGITHEQANTKGNTMWQADVDDDNKLKKKRTVKKDALRKRRLHADLERNDAIDTTEERQQQRSTVKRSQYTQQKHQHEQRQPIQSRKPQQLVDRKNASGGRKRQRRHLEDDECSGNITGGRKPALHVDTKQLLITINQPRPVREPIVDNYGTPFSNSINSPIQQFDPVTPHSRQGLFIRGAAAAAAAASTTTAHTPESRRFIFDNQPFSFRPLQNEQLNYHYHHQQPHHLATTNQEEPTTILRGIPEKNMVFSSNQQQLPPNTQHQYDRMDNHHVNNLDHEGPTTILRGIPVKKKKSFVNHRQHPHPHQQSKSTPIHHHQHQQILQRLGDSIDLSGTASTKTRGESSRKRQKMNKDNSNAPSSNVIISNLPPTVTVSAIKSLGSNDITFISLNQKTNSATVRFKTKAIAVKFRQKRNRAMISGQRISVDFIDK